MNARTKKNIIRNSPFLAELIGLINAEAHTLRTTGALSASQQIELVALIERVSDQDDLMADLRQLSCSLKSVSNSVSMHMDEVDWEEELKNNA